MQVKHSIQFIDDALTPHALFSRSRWWTERSNRCSRRAAGGAWGLSRRGRRRAAVGLLVARVSSPHPLREAAGRMYSVRGAAPPFFLLDLGLASAHDREHAEAFRRRCGTLSASRRLLRAASNLGATATATTSSRDLPINPADQAPSTDDEVHPR